MTQCIKADVHDRAGEELQSLARFCKAQQTAFRKLIKKHKKWTGSAELEADFNTHVLGDSSSFANVDLTPLYTEYEETLSILRTLYHERISGTSRPSDHDADAQDTTTQLRKIVESKSLVQFDSYLATLPLGRGGKNAVYWVHPDNVVELQILLLQHTRSLASRKQSSTPSPALSRHNSIASSMGRKNSIANEADTAVIVADDIERFVAQQSSSTFDEREDAMGGVLQEAAIHARLTKDDDAMITARVEDKDVQDFSIKRKSIPAILGSSSTLSKRKRSISNENKSADGLRTWLTQHEKIKPLTTITSNRARFVETTTDSSGFILATLDKSIGMKQANLSEDAFSLNGIADFPFAVLRVRQEGFENATLIKILDQSHLVERVRGFSLEYQAVWYCCQPENVVPPFWTSLMQKDIRKVPTAVSRCRAYKGDSSYGSQSTTPQMSTSNGSVGDRTGDLTAVEEGSPAKVKIPDQLQTPPLSAFRKKRKSAYERAGDTLPKQTYWSEYDHPSDSEDDGAYVLYIDPNEESSATKTWRRIRGLWSSKQAPDQETLLGHDGARDNALTEDTLTSSDEEGQTSRRSKRLSYGTLGHPIKQHTPYDRENYSQPDWVPQLTATCLVASLLLLCIGYLLIATGKKKLASEVDAGVVLAVASSLAFAVSGAGVTFGRRSPSWPVAILVVGVLIVDIAAASTMLVWAFG